MRIHHALSCAAMLTACVSVDPEPALEAVQQLGAERTGTEVVWVRSVEEQREVDEIVRSLLEGGLTRDEAARVAVLNDPVLQARLADLGIAAADLAQASMPSNPTVDFYWAFPADSGNTSLGITGWLSDLWTLPRRKKVAQMDVLIVQYEVALDVMRTAMGAAAAWDELISARQALAIDGEVGLTLQNIATRREIRYAHGLDSTMLVQAATARHADHLALIEAGEQRVTAAQNDLDRRLALTGVSRHIPQDVAFVPYAAAGYTLQQVLDLGMSERLDLAVAEAAVERQVRQMGLEDAMVWNSVALGVGADGRFGDLVTSDASLGPILSVEVPVFDDNRAGKERAGYQLQQAEKSLQAVQWQAATDLSVRFRAHERATRSLAFLEDSALPAADAAQAYTQEWTGKMQLAYLQDQEAHLELLMTRHAIVDSRRAVNQSWRDLQMALRGGPM